MIWNIQVIKKKAHTRYIPVVSYFENGCFTRTSYHSEFDHNNTYPFTRTTRVCEPEIDGDTRWLNYDI